MKYIVFWISILSITMTLNSCVKHEQNWDDVKLNQAINFANEIGTFGLVVQTDGEILASYGDIDSLSRVASIRKAILMALVSQHLDKINLQSTLADLNVDDTPIPLTDLQKQTKVIHLLKSTSGINHPIGSQTGFMKRLRDSLLGNEPNIPGAKWAYNNWDYHALTTVFEQETGIPLGDAFKNGIARPLGIKRFDSFYKKDTTLSIHPKVGFRLSTRDMAKFGQLFLNNGQWDKQQVIPKSWVERITQDYTETGVNVPDRYGHGYLWWIPSPNYAGGLPVGSFMANGSGGQRILVIPEWKMVIAHKTMNEGPREKRTRVSTKQFEQLVKLIKESKK
ncbi:MAG TPA: serine hydrolase [Bacteroidales bacterium]|jgi:CubicO group peptidase (beta-lactamase class C family)|nr:serine hydrolase [Bacteroidales bacterium]